MLYPQQNQFRNLQDLSGVWDFQTDPAGLGEAQGWAGSLPEARPVAVPGSWNEQYANLAAYAGPAWYARTFSVPAGWQGQRVWLQLDPAFDSVEVWLNGQRMGGHADGLLPLEVNLTTGLDWGGVNTLAIRVENATPPDGGQAGAPLDRTDSSGLRRPVLLFSTPPDALEDVAVTSEVEGSYGVVEFTVRRSGSGGRGRVRLSGAGQTFEAALVFVGSQAHAVLTVRSAHLWSPEDPFLYEAMLTLLDGAAECDCYRMPVGIRAVRGTRQRETTAPQPGPAAAVHALSPEAPAPLTSGDPVLLALGKIAERLDQKYPGMDRVLGFNLEGAGFYCLVIEKGRARAAAGEAPTDAVVRMKPEDAVKVMTGELNPVMAVMTGRIKVSGDMKALMILQNL